MPAETETYAARFATALDRAAHAGNWAVVPIDLTVSTARSIGQFSIAERVDKYGVVIKDFTFEADGSTISLLDEEATQKRAASGDAAH